MKERERDHNAIKSSMYNKSCITFEGLLNIPIFEAS